MGYGILVLLGVVFLVFILFQGIGDPAKMLLGQTGDSTTIANVRKDLHLDQPKWKQSLLYLNDVSPIAIHDKSEIEKNHLKGFFIHINSATTFAFKMPYLGRSYQSRQNVTEILGEAFPATLLLALAAMTIATVFGILFGIFSANKYGTWWDNFTLTSTIIGISVPSFFAGILIAYLFGFVLTDITGLHMTGSLYEYDVFDGKHLALSNIILPAITLGIRPLSIITQLTRSSMLDVLQQDFIRTAKAKGLPAKTITYKHALPNALNPVITAVTGWFAELLAGAFFVEYIFGWHGIGKVTVDALNNLDFPVVMGSVLLTAAFFTLVNILADLLYGFVDPRARIQ